VIRNNGKAQRYSGSVDMMPGDSVLVLPKVESENLQIFSMLTQCGLKMGILTKLELDYEIDDIEKFLQFFRTMCDRFEPLIIQL
ncbi:hypothetical protein VWN94_10730, partial [Campylobacter coli]|nr:hypothetical protein [Campylobacter coli]